MQSRQESVVTLAKYQYSIQHIASTTASQGLLHASYCTHYTFSEGKCYHYEVQETHQ